MAINHAQLSFIWTETVLDLLQDRPPHAAQFVFLGRRYSFAPVFDRAGKERVSMGTLTPTILQRPWPKPTGQRFWTSYLEQRRPAKLSGDQAWKNLVPFRANFPFALQAPWLTGFITVEAFFYPHGQALIITVKTQTALSLHDAVDLAFKVRRGERFNLQTPEQSCGFSLDTLADTILDRTRTSAFGPGVEGRRLALEPFSIFTVISATDVPVADVVVNGSEVHRALEALTNWRNTWRDDTLPALSQKTLPTQDPHPVSHLLYVGKRGRTIWFPALFTASGPVSSLTCYHRNLVFASLQVESLAGLTRETAKQISTGPALTSAHAECARNAAGILGRLYGAHSSTYRSWSPHRHIDDNELAVEINNVRSYFSMPSLS
jgi:hypothetical protein